MMKKTLVIAFATASAVSFAQTFSNPATFNIPASGTGGTNSGAANSTVRSTIEVSGVAGSLLGITVDFFGLGGTFPDDLDFMLVAPDGSRTILMSDAGGGTDVSGINLTFDDGAGSGVADSSALTSGTYLPTNFGTGDVWYRADGTEETAATTASLATFLNIDPNGTWTLWARDDASGDVHTLDGGWAINIQAVPEPTTIAALGLGAIALMRRRKSA